MTPEHGAFLLESVYLPLFQLEHPMTQAVIGAIPAERADYRPDSISRSAIDLAWHIAIAEDRFMRAAATGGFKFENSTRPEGVRTPADVLAWYKEKFSECIELLKKTPAERLVVPVDFRGMVTRPAVLFLQMSIGHAIHHRGQLSTYLRPMGAKVPSIYGESYDAREARERAAKAETQQKA
jgi:uncharacterized damage-inducible protein DinB